MSRLGSDKRLIAGYHERVEVLIGLISERDAAISALEYEVRRLTIELQKQTKVRALGLQAAGGEVGNWIVHWNSEEDMEWK